MKTWKILLIVVIISAIGFVAVPMNKLVEGLRVENEDLLKERTIKIAEWEDFTSQKNELEVLIVDPEIDIPPTLNQTELLIDLQKIASQTGIQLPSSWSFSVINDADSDLSKLTVSFPIKGSRGDIYKFMQLAEKNNRFLVINNFGVRTFYENNILVSEMNVNLQAFSQEKFNE